MIKHDLEAWLTWAERLRQVSLIVGAFAKILLQERASTTRM